MVLKNEEAPKSPDLAPPCASNVFEIKIKHHRKSNREFLLIPGCLRQISLKKHPSFCNRHHIRQ
ncbi:MAG: hypothetical protein D6714_17060 [Bacteroidetes bacterium]|nr:MAG: hypothetical protein D6714_17060 [Bacteroidota bacterium]